MRIGFIALAAALSFAVPSGPASAQSSEADLLKRFQTHQQTHRGLSLAPVTSTGAAKAGAAAAAKPAPAPAPAAAATAAIAPKPKASSGSTGTVRVVRPQQEPEPAYVRMPEGSEINIRIQFAYDSAVLAQSEFGKLETLCNAIRQSNVQLFHIFGHTDTSGSESYNLRLSRKRAEAVRGHMVNYCGISATRLRAIGVGESYPLITSNPRAPENRRVEFQAIG